MKNGKLYAQTASKCGQKKGSKDYKIILLENNYYFQICCWCKKMSRCKWNMLHHICHKKTMFSVQCPVPRAQCSFFLIRCFTHEWPWHPALTIITISSIVYTHTIFSSTAAVRFTCLPPYGIQWHYACKVTIPNPTSAKVITSHPDPYYVPCNEKSVRWDINL